MHPIPQKTALRARWRCARFARRQWRVRHLQRLPLVCLAIALLAAINCGDESAWRPTPGLSGYVRLQNQSDHSGVLLTIAELDSTAVTDSTGFFSFNGIPDGSWQIEAEYPYFETAMATAELSGGLLQHSVNMRLKQLLQFWIDPPEMTVSMSDGDDAYHFWIEADGYVANVSYHPVTVRATDNPWKITALRPRAGFVSGRCDTLYGWLCSSTIFEDFLFTYQPGDTLWYHIKKVYQSRCFEPGECELSWVITDQYHYPWHFWPYSELSSTLVRKKELLRPGRVRLVE